GADCGIVHSHTVAPWDWAWVDERRGRRRTASAAPDLMPRHRPRVAKSGQHRSYQPKSIKPAGGSQMPVVTVDLLAGRGPEELRAITDAIHTALGNPRQGWITSTVEGAPVTRVAATRARLRRSVDQTQLQAPDRQAPHDQREGDQHGGVLQVDRGDRPQGDVTHERDAVVERVELRDRAQPLR